MTVTVKAQDQKLDLMVGLYDTEGKILAKKSVLEIGSTVTLTQTLPASGTYSVLVYGLGGTAYSNGAYTIVVQ